MARAMATASSAEGMSARWPGMVLTPAPMASFLLWILSPSASMAEARGPMKVTLRASSAATKAVFSERKP